MKAVSVFEFEDYKAFLMTYEDSRKSLERGFRSRLADFIGCQSSYVSHVLNGRAQFSLEQGLQIAEFVRLKAPERRHFLLLIEWARAGTLQLREYFQSEISKSRNEHLNLKERVGDSRQLSESEQSTYYSSWIYLAVHVASSLPSMRTAKDIASSLHLNNEVVAEAVLFLKECGIVIEKDGHLQPGLVQVHLSRDSALIRQHHTNWRVAAIQSLAQSGQTDVRYSTVSSLSKADAEKLRAQMVALIENYVRTVGPSAEEMVYNFNLDFYSLIR